MQTMRLTGGLVATGLQSLSAAAQQRYESFDAAVDVRAGEVARHGSQR